MSQSTGVRGFGPGPSYRDAGDGDRCPQDREHGHMYFVDPAKTRQWCPSSRHQGNTFYRRDGQTPAIAAAVLA